MNAKEALAYIEEVIHYRHPRVPDAIATLTAALDERDALLKACEQSSHALLHVEAFLAGILEADPHRITPMDEVIEARKQARAAIKQAKGDT